MTATPLSRAGVSSVETLVRRILRTFDRATSADIEAGARWYDEAGDLATDLAARGHCSREAAAIVIAHLSPRTSWVRNVLGAEYLLVAGRHPEDAGCIGDNSDRARDALEAHDPWETFGATAHKTRNFARNILGDREAVTVDVWAARVVDVTEQQLRLSGVYDLVAHAYRLAARRRGVDPSTMQATTWIVARGGRAS